MLTRLGQFGVGLFLAASLAVTAGCGGGGGGSSDTGGGSGAQQVPAPGTNATAGPADPLQTVLLDVAAGADSAPVVGDTAQALINSLVSLLEAPDGLAAGFQDFLASQNPDDLFSGGEAAGVAVLSFATGLSETLIQLSEEGQAIPGSENILPLLTDLQEQVQDGISGQTDGGDLTAVTDLLVQIATELDAASGQVPSQVEEAPLVGDLLAALGDGADDLATILDATGRLNGDETSAALVGSFENVLANLGGSLPTEQPDALTDAVAMATTQFENGLALLLNPLFQALRGVLAPVTGDASPLAPVLGSLLAGDLGGLGGESGLADLLTGGGLSSGGTSIPQLSTLLSGLPVLGDVLAGLPSGSSLPGGLGSLTTLLEQGGTGSVPLLGTLLQGIPNLTGDGATGPASLPVLGDLLTALLSLNQDGVPVIGQIAEAGGGAGSLDPANLGSALQDLVSDLIALFGLEANGGFLLPTEFDGLLDLGSVIEGLLGSILGLLGL